MNKFNTLEELNEYLINCTLCPRLVRHRASVADNPPKRYIGQKYWARPLPGFGDPTAQILIVGLAPAAHGGNRTGRMFTGNGSAVTLMHALYSAGLANQPYSISIDDGLRLFNCYLTASVRCAPPENKPTKSELDNCYQYLFEEFRLLPNVRVIVALGSIAFNTCVRLLKDYDYSCKVNKPMFEHGARYLFKKDDASRVIYLVCSYHPSRQNTQTRRLTQSMINRIFKMATRLCIKIHNE